MTPRSTHPAFLRMPTPYLQLFGVVVVQLVVLAFAPRPQIQQLLNLVFTLWLGAAAASIARMRRVFWAALVIGWTPALLELVVPASATPLALQLFKEVLWAVFPFYLSTRLVSPLFAAGEVSHRELVGAVSVYLLAGLGFANVYEVLYQLDPGSIAFGATALGAAPVFTDFLYFSFVTLATLGYGDVSPVSVAARTTAVTEALLGLLYVSILVGRMVGLHIADGMAGRQAYRATQDQRVP